MEWKDYWPKTYKRSTIGRYKIDNVAINGKRYWTVDHFNVFVKGGCETEEEAIAFANSHNEARIREALL